MRNLIAFDTTGIIETIEQKAEREAAEKHCSDLMRRIRKMLNRQSRNSRENKDIAKCFALYLDKYPQLFALEYSEINRDVLKWTFNEDITINRMLIDKIQGVEKNLNLDIHHIW